MNAPHPLDHILHAKQAGKRVGIAAVCSAHPWVLRAALGASLQSGGDLLVEATCNQVNQFGGYTGMTPADFVDYVAGLAFACNFPGERLILGGDHLGPNVWQHEPVERAMQKAIEMTAAYARAGFTKLHLDASMPCADDGPGELPVEQIAHRAACLARAAEDSAPDPGRLRYIIGSEVPTPGGAHDFETSVCVTRPEDVAETITATRRAFEQAGLSAAWERVIAVVVQPGVEFGDDFILEYQPAPAAPLASFIAAQPGLVYEAHSTDYQTRAALSCLVQDHFAILKVGPALTFAFREAVFALAAIEAELFSPGECSGLRLALEDAALRNPEHWRKYYQGSSQEMAFKRKYSLSDRIRYYWGDARVQAALARLLANLSQRAIPLSLLSQYLPLQYARVRAGSLSNHPEAIISDRVQQALGDYRLACQG